MSRRMSCSMTIDAVRDRTKTVTRRKLGTWLNLRPGDHLTLIEKGMGLAKGTKQVVLAEVEVVSVRDEEIACVTADEVIAEGFGRFNWTPADFIRFWLGSHGYNAGRVNEGAVYCRRIEWRYLDG